MGHQEIHPVALEGQADRPYLVDQVGVVDRADPQFREAQVGVVEQGGQDDPVDLEAHEDQVEQGEVAGQEDHLNWEGQGEEGEIEVHQKGVVGAADKKLDQLVT